MEIKPLGYVPAKAIKSAIEKLEKDAMQENINFDEIQISFEYLIGSFFPSIIDNIYTEVNQQYTLGYLAGLKEGKNDSQGHQ